TAYDVSRDWSSDVCSSDLATYGDGPFALSATATSGLAVTFTSAPSTACATSGQHGATRTIVGAGTCTITANQAGDDNWEAAPERSEERRVGKERRPEGHRG